MYGQLTEQDNKYLMESPLEARRLEQKTCPEETERQLELVGLKSRMTALDAGCGSGAVARVMSKIVGPDGRVTAADRSLERLEFAGNAASRDEYDNLIFTSTNLTEGPVADSAFDFVWCRFVFEYLNQPDVALGHLVQATKVGGKLVVGELDGNGQFHYPMSEKLGRGLKILTNALDGRFDPYAGRKLFHRFCRQPLGDVRVHILPYHVYAGPAGALDMENWTAKFDTLREIGVSVFGSHSSYRDWVAEFLKHLSDPSGFTYSILILVEGVRLK